MTFLEMMYTNFITDERKIPKAIIRLNFVLIVHSTDEHLPS